MQLFKACVCSFTISLLLIICGIAFIFGWPALFNHIISSNMVLTPSSHTYEIWKEFPVPLIIDFYFFNWTNPNEVYNTSVKPKFEQIGPYRFRETKEKADIVWNRNGTVSYRHLKYWYYKDDSKLNTSLQDLLTTVNPIILSAVYSARDWSYLLRKGMSVPLSSMSPTVHITKTVGEMLFEGYEDPLIKLAKTLPFLAGNSLPPWDRFGWFYTRNGSTSFEGIFNMGTGEGTEFGELYNWNYWNQTPYYQRDCGKIKGSAGEFFKSHPSKDSITLFSPDLCRSMQLDYVGESNVANILGNKYSLSPRMLDNGSLYPENECFCNGECVPSGVLNVSSCRFNSPSFASLPHFYNADPYFVNLVDGLKSDRKKHEFFITLEPTTGIPLEVNARLQLNLLMQPVSGIQLFQNVPRIFVPMLWFEQKVKIPDDEAFKLKFLLNLPVICSSIGILLIVIGLILASCSVYKVCTTSLCKKEKENYYHTEQQVPLKNEHRAEIVKVS